MLDHLVPHLLLLLLRSQSFQNLGNFETFIFKHGCTLVIVFLNNCLPLI